ncbi:hypothetical protein GRF61_06260 [Azoarcus sp. TTM-91]|uniref:hypothetical protein n=1 Tax=Azoarcus sp. TTM-91 TaxID=2691581 RepID=UPI00145C813B|nr:hypothetical protein [Azoarcus sp. TTM-91]NMG34054.1 hypothetical protein [Azoarcus sp. TTM-91]
MHRSPAGLERSGETWVRRCDAVEIRDHQQAGPQDFVTWDCHFRLRARELPIDGASHLHFTDDGRVHAHRDYWDAAETVLARLPLASPMV